MKTVTLKIHGRDIDFTDQPPTRAGAYWHLWHSKAAPELVQTECKAGQEWVGLWSAPLVPATEVESAWEESRRSVGCYGECDAITNGTQWVESRARRVVEGLE